MIVRYEANGYKLERHNIAMNRREFIAFRSLFLYMDTKAELEKEVKRLDTANYKHKVVKAYIKK